MKNTSQMMKTLKCLTVVSVFAIYSVGFNPASLEAWGKKVRTGTDVLSPQELQQLTALQENKRRGNPGDKSPGGPKPLYESDQGFQAEVQAAQGRNSMSAIQQVRDGAQQASQQQIQSAFLRNVQQIKQLIATGKIKGEPSAAAARSNTELQTILGSHIARLEASGDTSPETKAQIGRLQNMANASTAFAGITATIKKYEDLSAKHETAAGSTAGGAELADFSTAAMNEFLTQVSTYATFRQGEAVKSLAAMPQLGPQIGGMDGAGVQEHIETMFGHEDARDKWQGVAYNTKQAVDKITKLNTAVQTIDKMTDSPEYQAIASNEYVSDDAKGMAQTMLAAGEAVKGISSILGAEMGNVPAAILSQAGDGIKSIGLAVGWAGNLEGQKRQGGRGGIATDHLGQLEDFQASGMRVLWNGSTGELTIPDGSGDKAGDVTLSGDKAQELRDAVSSFTSLTGRNPTQAEINLLAAGGRLDVGGGKRMGMGTLADPHNRTNFDVRGGERAQLDAFLDRALAGVPDDKLTIYDPDTGKVRPMTDDEKREVFGEKLERMNALSQALHGTDIDPNIFGADVINDGKWTEKMEQDLEDKKEQDGDQGPEDKEDPKDQQPAPQVPQPPVEPPADGKDDGRDPNTGLTAEERIGIDAANRRRAQEAAEKAAAEEKKKKEEAERKAAEEKKEKEEAEKKKREEEAERKRAEEEAERSGVSSSTAGTGGGCALFGEMVADSMFEDYDRVNAGSRGGKATPDARDMAAGPAEVSTPQPSGGGHHHEEW